MITLKEKQTNSITFQKEIDTPLVTSSYDTGSVYNIITYPTLANDTGSAGITFTTSSNEDNPRWTTLEFDITSSSDYENKKIKGLPGTTYNLEVWYGPIVSGTSLVWGTTAETWTGTDEIWSSADDDTPTYNNVTRNAVLKYSDRIFVSGAVSPIEKKYISSNENATYTVYQG